MRRPDEEGREGGRKPPRGPPPSPAPSRPTAAASRGALLEPPRGPGKGGAAVGGRGLAAAAEGRESGPLRKSAGGVRFLLLKAAANARARQTLPLPLAPPQPAPGSPQPRRALPPGRAASAKKVSIFSSESRARQGPPPAPKPAGCAAPRVGLHVYNARFSSAKQRCAGCATSFRVVETFWGNSSSVFCDL